MKKLTLLLVSIFTVLISFAGEVTEEQALVIAQQFMRGKQFKQKNLHRTRSVGDTKSFYIFNVDKNGSLVYYLKEFLANTIVEGAVGGGVAVFS